MNLATFLIGIPVALLALYDILLRLRDGRQRKLASKAKDAEREWLRRQCDEALDHNERRITGLIDGRHAGRGTLESGMRNQDREDARAWFDRTREMVKTADTETLRGVLFDLEPAPRLPVSSAEIWRDETAKQLYDLAAAARSLVDDELDQRRRRT